MPEFIRKMQEQAKDFWNNLDKSQKTRIIATSVLLVVAIGVGIFLLTRTNYVPLLNISDSKDAKEIIKLLDEKKIKYKEGNDGRILVDERDKNKAEFALSVAGLTKEGMTFENAWNLIKINSTESDKKRLWNNLLKENIRTKLLMFDNIKDASIEIALPEKSLFVDKNAEKPKASIVVVPKNGEISPEQAQAIVRVVASSIEGLDPKDVTVVDNNLNELTTEQNNDLLGATSTQYKLRLKVKEELEKSVKNLYSGKSDSFDAIKVVANPVLDFNRQKSTINDVQKPTNLDEAVVSQQKTQESLVNGNQGGVPGTDTNPGNTPGYQIGQNGNSTYDKKSETINRKFKEIMTEEEKALGDLNFDKSSVAVSLWYGQRVQDDSKLTEEFINQVKQDVSGATGIPVARISVNKYKLAPMEQETKSATDTIKELIDLYGLPAILLILFIAFLIAVMPRKKKKDEFEGAELAEGEDVELGETIDNIESTEEIKEIEIDDRSEVMKQIDKFAEQKPEAIAQLLRNWLSDEWE